MISSEQPEIIGMCDRVLVMREGVLAGELEARGKAADALDLLIRGADMLPLPLLFRRLLQLARVCRQPRLMEAMLDKLQISPDRRETLLAKAHASLREARKRGDDMLVRLLRQWLAENSLQPDGGA